MLQHPCSTLSGVRLIPWPNRPHHGLSGVKAENKFKIFKEKIGLANKGFDSRSIAEFSFIRVVIDQHGWGKLCEVPKAYNLLLLRECYSELAAVETKM